jgi:hypothetical protein
VGYSIRPTDEQQALVDRLNKVVRSSDEFNRAAAAGRLKKIPTGDGMALIFHDSPEQPVECAVEISRVLMMDCGDAGHILLSKRVAEDPRFKEMIAAAEVRVASKTPKNYSIDKMSTGPTGVSLCYDTA